MELWTSEVESSRRFYAELFGWVAEEPSPEHGGYFMFTRDGVPVAGAIGDIGDLHADDTWKPYLASGDIGQTLRLAADHGAKVLGPAMPVGDLGVQAVITDRQGLVIGVWQPGTFPGFTVINEDGAPRFFAFDTEDYHGAVDFYRKVFGWDPLEETTDDGHHYAGYMDPETGRPLAGIGDEVENLAPGAAPAWSVFWQSDDLDAAVARVLALGGSVLNAPRDGGLGRVAHVADPAGAPFLLCEPKH
ncbi:MAG TPA: VOC family protein [Acidimicrobiales bacterium]|nr:VOC family protein [Acidimicrobiales bacterium]